MSLQQPPPSEPIIGVDPSFRYLGVCIAEAPPGFYTEQKWSEKANRMYDHQYAWAIEQFNLRWWECMQVSTKELAKITPSAIPPRVHLAVETIKLEWQKRYPTVVPRIAFEWSFVGTMTAATVNHLTYVGALYHELWKWSGGNVVRVAPASHQRFLYRYAGVRLFGEKWNPKGKKKIEKGEVQQFVDQLYEGYWKEVGAHPVNPRNNYRSKVKSTKKQYEAVADAVSVAVAAAADWERFKAAA